MRGMTEEDFEEGLNSLCDEAREAGFELTWLLRALDVQRQIILSQENLKIRDALVEGKKIKYNDKGIIEFREKNEREL